ncbi:transcription termination/antitermination protein NusG [Azospirillum canadense]|uniref:transcription termination/antitermination protein NusG n=1 Tax=Azospirillum canadense TaxID=403962 RepID=UPI00222794E0|nr:transcription termination/antitermination NusG family protein [Azospirillum canadense]MCW2243598.1 transcriptional antiterminator RfaH [Azospirillum canadense]
MDMFSDREWFAVVSHVGTQHYLRASKELERQGYRVFAPMCRRERRNASKVEAVIRPLFDRYLFVGMHSEQPFHPITCTRGVAFVVRGFRNMPSRVSPLALRRVKARCDAFEDGVIDFTSSKRKELAAKWSKNQPVRISSGPFADFIGLFAGASGNVVQVVIEIFGRQTPVSIAPQHLRPTEVAG